MVQGPHRTMRTILAGMLLCTAFAVAQDHAQSKPELRTEPTAQTTPEDIARGKALTDARRLRKLPYRRSRKTVRRGQADRYPLWQHLLAQSDAGSRDGLRRLER
jgi:hypothetical protein